MQDSLFNEKTAIFVSCSIASEKGEPSRMCHIFIFVLFVAIFFLHFLLLSELFLKYFLCGEQLSLLLRN